MKLEELEAKVDLVIADAVRFRRERDVLLAALKEAADELALGDYPEDGESRMVRRFYDLIETVTLADKGEASSSLPPLSSS